MTDEKKPAAEATANALREQLRKLKSASTFSKAEEAERFGAMLIVVIEHIDQRLEKLEIAHNVER